MQRFVEDFLPILVILGIIVAVSAYRARKEPPTPKLKDSVRGKLAKVGIIVFGLTLFIGIAYLINPNGVPKLVVKSILAVLSFLFKAF